MIKRLLDIIISSIGLICISPILLLVSFLIWKYDKKSPFYIAPRVGKNGTIFNIIKLRSMLVDSDMFGVNSTSNNDPRITPIGQKIRKYKLDELTQLYNVWLGDMSLVGPRPNVKAETDSYTETEKELLSIKPGITDFSSIVFSDEGKILQNEKHPDLAYKKLIRPWKGRLGLIYIKNKSLSLDIEIIIYTLISLILRDKALDLISRKLKKLGADQEIIDISKRKINLYSVMPSD
jgi:lipopolysaccharide/colanic/teichoic acid biosynthesis glycosyltransferase